MALLMEIKNGGKEHFSTYLRLPLSMPTFCMWHTVSKQTTETLKILNCVATTTAVRCGATYSGQQNGSYRSNLPTVTKLTEHHIIVQYNSGSTQEKTTAQLCCMLGWYVRPPATSESNASTCTHGIQME